MWAIGRFDLGLTDRQFGELTPAMFEALLLRKHEDHKRRCFYAGLTAAAVYNANPFRGKDAKAVSPLDFRPSDKAAKAQCLKEQIAVFTVALGCGPGSPRSKSKIEHRRSKVANLKR